VFINKVVNKVISSANMQWSKGQDPLLGSNAFGLMYNDFEGEKTLLVAN